MTKTQPKSSRREPCVGPFWGIGSRPTKVIGKTVPISQALSYGDCLTSDDGHYEVWTEWQKYGPKGLIWRNLPALIAWEEYDDHPRGRVVFDVQQNVFIIYADQKLQAPEILEGIRTFFCLQHTNVSVRSDEHYRT